MKLKILSWNVRGVNNSEKRKLIKNFIRTQKADLVCVQETKIRNMSDVIARSIEVGRFVDWWVLEVEGTAGGILLLWDKRKLDFLDSEIGSFSISCLFRNVEDGFQWTFTRVYGPIEGNRRKLFWEELGSIRGLWEGPWCLRGEERGEGSHPLWDVLLMW